MPAILQAEQRSPLWFESRLGVATASRFKDIMARTRTGYSAQRKNYMAELVSERLTGASQDNYQSQAMQWGVENEDTALLEYSLLTNVEVEQTSLWLHDTLKAGASPDGLVSDDGIVEIKCPNTATHIETLQKRSVPSQYWSQVQGQLWITERLWCDFISYDPRLPANAQLIVLHVERDEEYIAKLEQEVKEFLQEVDDQVEFVKNFKGE
jgi:putative phage-type endonuclease